MKDGMILTNFDIPVEEIEKVEKMIEQEEEVKRMMYS